MKRSRKWNARTGFGEPTVLEPAGCRPDGQTCASLKAGDLVLLEPTNAWAEKAGIVGGPALVLVTDGLNGLKVLTRNQKQVWVSVNEVEVINESR